MHTPKYILKTQLKLLLIEIADHPEVSDADLKSIIDDSMYELGEATRRNLETRAKLRLIDCQAMASKAPAVLSGRQ